MKTKSFVMMLGIMLSVSMGCGNNYKEEIIVQDDKAQEEQGNDMATNEEQENDMTANEEVGVLLETEMYKSSSTEERKMLAKELLERLVQEGKITHYDYDERQKLFSYVDEKGTRGGILLEEFLPGMN